MSSIGNISQWGEVKKKTKDRARSKVKEPSSSTEVVGASTRGGRGRGGSEGHRGGRGRGADRVRGAGRTARGGVTTNGARPSVTDKLTTDLGHEPLVDSTTTENATAADATAATGDPMENSWDQPLQPNNRSPDASSWEMVTPAEAQSIEAQKSSSKPDGTRSWASIFNKPTPHSRSKVPPAVPALERAPESPALPEVNKAIVDEPGLPPPVAPEESISDLPSTPPTEHLPPSEQAINITPSKDELTETNLEQVLDTTQGPPLTATAASTVASTHDPRSVAGNATPALAQQPLTAMRPGLGGFATSAYKATAGPGRTASFQRRVLEQQEAVVMPSNHAVDRAAVQFGRMGLGDSSEDLDVDDDREEAETRTQPPQHSPVAPRATLPPAPQQPPIETTPTPRQAPGLPPLSQQPSASQQPFLQQPIQPSTNEQGHSQQPAQTVHPYNQFNNRYAPPSTQPEMPAPAQKAYEPFGQQFQQSSTQQHQYDGYPSQSQAQQQPGQQPNASYSTAAQDYSSYYTSDSQRNAYQNFYGNYGQPAQQSHQDAGNSQQRTSSAFGSSGTEQPSQYATSQVQQVPQARYGSAGEAQNSGHSTPNPNQAGQPGHNQVQQPHHMAQQHAQGQAGGQHGAYPYGHPFYNNSPYYPSYMNQVSQHHSYGRERPMFDDVRRYDDYNLTHNHQFGYGGNQGGYGGGPYGGKQGMYGQPHQGYGMSPQSSYDHHSASPANVGGYGQQHTMPGREGALGGGLGVYGRTGSTQAPDSQSQQAGNPGAFGSMPDVFGRSQSVFTGQSQGMSQQPSGQGGSEEASRGYGDSSKIPGGPSPAAGQSGGRPGSAVNNMQGQNGIPSHNHGQQGYSGYPNQMGHQMHGQQNSQYGAGLGGLGSHHQSGAQSHQGGAYGGGYGAGFSGSYYGNNNRGGWGGNYGH